MDVVKHHLRALKLNNHVKIMRVVWIDKLKSHRHHFCSRSGNLWSYVDFGLAWSTSL